MSQSVPRKKRADGVSTLLLGWEIVPNHDFIFFILVLLLLLRLSRCNHVLVIEMENGKNDIEERSSSCAGSKVNRICDILEFPALQM